MSEHKHGEPWEVENDGTIWTETERYLARFQVIDDADRAVLCVNACAGMSDEVVGGLPPKFIEVNMENVAIGNALIKRNDALKADLAEAVELLERHCKGCLIEMHGDNTKCHLVTCDTRDFLTKHKETN